MAKRFIDTEIFKKRWLRELPMSYKLLYIYIFTDCNHWGVWEVDLEVAAIRLRCPELVNEEPQILAAFGPQVEAYREDRWWLKEFCDFQYGPLKETNRMHLSVIEGLKKENLYENYLGSTKGLTSPLQGVKDKVQDKDKDKEQEKWPTFEDFWEEYDKKIGRKDKVQSKWRRLCQTDKEKVMAYLPRYKNAEPDKQYRKNPETFLNNESWNDEIITSKEKPNGKETPQEYTTRMRNEGYRYEKIETNTGYTYQWIK